jgi:flagellar basal body-associated protein FliL
MVRNEMRDQADQPEVSDVVDLSSAAVPGGATGEADTVARLSLLARLPQLFSFRTLVHGRRLFALLAAGVVAVVLAVAGILMYDGEAPSKNALTPLPVPRMADTVYLKNFVIDCRDGKNTLRLVTCDIALELRERRDIALLEGDARLRDAIYRLAKRNGAGQFRAMESRNKVKKEMGELLNQLLGENIVRTVHFTKLLIL